MRTLLSIMLMTVPLTRLVACSCAGPGTPCSATGSAAAVFTGTVLGIASQASSLPAGVPIGSERRSGDSSRSAHVAPPLRIVRIQVENVLTGIGHGQKQIEIFTGLGGPDCGYPFQEGGGYVVYAYENAEGHLETNVCTRTRPLAQADEDLAYFRVMANAPEVGTIRVHTAYGNTPGKVGVPMIAERDGSRHRALTNDAGEAVFPDLPAGRYTIHAESDGDLSDDPAVQLHAKGSVDVILFRTLRISGRILTKDGVPAARVEIHLRSVANVPADGASTGPDGRYELRITAPGQYYLGINLNHSATDETPYPRPALVLSWDG